MGADAVKVAQACGYYSAGTVEFLLDESGHYYFLEMNTRIQVEHPITEMVTGVDLVIEQIRVAAGEKLSITQEQLTQRGHAIECRIYAEDGENNFMPSIGKVLHYTEPSGPGVRVDSGIVNGTEVTIDYDPILAKLIVHAPDRKTAIEKMIHALHDYKILGVKTSKRFMVDVLSHAAFIDGKTFTNFIDTYMRDRATDLNGYKELAVALAAVASSERTTAPASDGTKVGTPSIWATVGNWQIGDSIHE
jgi:acetyl/propionyl-CoA carboxylase alpha subunit